eukprot:TRINITY_DN10050_c0_g1_i2.p1 TRINITY_DN10050_c0_g1~~TRINITY_DN10050_c0_g1_i2.p1  ORF type:complete len:516 (+),score=99.42 TRINITY_DN10050_c0_g1_i2:41-1549(+)
MCPDPQGQAFRAVASNAGTQEDDWYAEHVRRVMSAADWPWPERSVLDPRHRPRFVWSVEEFLRELQYGCHLDEIVVFPDGLRQLGQHEALHPQVRAAVDRVGTASDDATVLSSYDVLRALDEANALPDLKGKVAFQRRRGAGPDVEPGRQDCAGGRGNGCLVGKWDAIQATCPEDARERVYIAELRRVEPQEGPDGRRRKSTLSSTMRERLLNHGLDVRRLLYWDDYSEGVFIGGDCAGYRFHVDCMQTSNVGSLYDGHKLMAIWSYPDATKAAMDDHYDEIFTPPLSSSQMRALDNACCVALAPPGSVYLFSGANAHVVCNVGFAAPPAGGGVPRRSLCVASYEAFTNLNLRHAAVVAATNTDLHCEECWLDDEDMEDFEDDLAENMLYILRKFMSEGNSDSRKMQAAVATLCAGSRQIHSLLLQKLEKLEDLEPVSVAALSALTSLVPAAASAPSSPTQDAKMQDSISVHLASGEPSVHGVEKRRRVEDLSALTSVDDLA